MNYLERRVGIFYHDRRWAYQIFKELLNGIPQAAIEKVFGTTIVFYDGSFLMMIPANDSSRGLALTDAYIQDGVSKAIYDDVIRRCIKPIHKDAVVINEARDIKFGRLANAEYWMDKQGLEEI